MQQRCGRWSGKCAEKKRGTMTSSLLTEQSGKTGGRRYNRSEQHREDNGRQTLSPTSIGSPSSPSCLVYMCKRTPVQLFGPEELAAVALTWKREKSTGPDRVSFEGIKGIFAKGDQWMGKMADVMGEDRGKHGQNWNQHSLRQRRPCVHKAKHERWSTFILRQIWHMHGLGRVARGCEMGKNFWRGRVYFGGRGSNVSAKGPGTLDGSIRHWMLRGVWWKSRNWKTCARIVDGGKTMLKSAYINSTSHGPLANSQLENLKPNSASKPTERERERETPFAMTVSLPLPWCMSDEETF